MFSVDATERTVTFNLMARPQNSYNYVALGFSKDRLMGDDLTVACISIYGSVFLQTGYNDGQKNVRIPSNNLTQFIGYRDDNGKILCAFTRPILLEFTASSAQTLSHDLSDSFHVFVAWGSTFDGSDVIRRHIQAPVVSDHAVDFFSTDVWRGSVMHRLIRAHSAFMAVTWMGFAILTITVPKFFKTTFGDSRIYGVQVWFAIHQCGAVATLLCTVIGLILALADEGGEITHNRSAYIHACLGFTVVAVVLAQAAMGLFRPGIDSKWRPVFNLAHHFLGGSIMHLAVAALLFAYANHEFSHEMKRFGWTAIITWGIIYVIFLLGLKGRSYISRYLYILLPQRQGYVTSKTSIASEKEVGTDHVTEHETTSRGGYVVFIVFLLFVICSIVTALCMTIFY